jgi:hypothetical protein
MADKGRLWQPMITCLCLFKLSTSTTKSSVFRGTRPIDQSKNSHSHAYYHSHKCIRFAASTFATFSTKSTSSPMTSFSGQALLTKHFKLQVNPIIFTSTNEYSLWMSCFVKRSASRSLNSSIPNILVKLFKFLPISSTLRRLAWNCSHYFLEPDPRHQQVVLSTSRH